MPHVMWNISMGDQKQERVQEVVARYILDVDKPDRLSPLIEQVLLLGPVLARKTLGYINS